MAPQTPQSDRRTASATFLLNQIIAQNVQLTFNGNEIAKQTGIKFVSVKSKIGQIRKDWPGLKVKLVSEGAAGAAVVKENSEANAGHDGVVDTKAKATTKGSRRSLRLHGNDGDHGREEDKVQEDGVVSVKSDEQDLGKKSQEEVVSENESRGGPQLHLRRMRQLYRAYYRAGKNAKSAIAHEGDADEEISTTLANVKPNTGREDSELESDFGSQTEQKVVSKVDAEDAVEASAGRAKSRSFIEKLIDVDNTLPARKRKRSLSLGRLMEYQQAGANEEQGVVDHGQQSVDDSISTTEQSPGKKTAAVRDLGIELTTNMEKFEKVRAAAHDLSQVGMTSSADEGTIQKSQEQDVEHKHRSQFSRPLAWQVYLHANSRRP